MPSPNSASPAAIALSASESLPGTLHIDNAAPMVTTLEENYNGSAVVVEGGVPGCYCLSQCMNIIERIASGSRCPTQLVNKERACSKCYTLPPRTRAAGLHLPPLADRRQPCQLEPRHRPPPQRARRGLRCGQFPLRDRNSTRLRCSSSPRGGSRRCQ